MNHTEESGIEQRAVVTMLGYVKLGYKLDSVGTNGGLYLRLNQRVNYFSDWKICSYLDILLQIIRKNCEKTVLSSHSRQTLHTQQQLPQELWRYMENNEVLVLSCTPYTFEGTGNLRKNLVAIYSILMDLF